VITIQSAMLVALGFFTAGLIGFLLAPFYGRRSARIATETMRATMPLSSTEIAADKDRLRANYALTIHKLEQKVEKAAYSAARQRVELNRRDAGISELEQEVERLRSQLEEHENARRVLEQTIAERMPKVEFRLGEAKNMLMHRDREITNLTQASKRQTSALEEATQINAQQRDEIHRLNATLATRAARNRETLADPRFDGEVALRAEIEALRTKNRDQQALISRLQSAMASAESMPRADDSDPASKAEAKRQEASKALASSSAVAQMDISSELNRLRKDLVDAENALRSARGMAEANHAGQAALESEIRTLKTQNEDRSAEVAKLKAALATYQDEDVDDRTLKESKVAMRARLSALQAQSEEHTHTIQRLRAEIASANEKLARQAAHFMDEMRRLGAGTVPTGGARKDATSGRPAAAAPRQPLVDRIAAPRPSRPAQPLVAAQTPARRDGGGDQARVNGFLRALDGASASAATEQKGTEGELPEANANGEAAPKKTERRASLIERITRAEKPVA
jgi:DNA repair exonuclease SbcCD ATPase subunit